MMHVTGGWVCAALDLCWQHTGGEPGLGGCTALAWGTTHSVLLSLHRSTGPAYLGYHLGDTACMYQHAYILDRVHI